MDRHRASGPTAMLTSEPDSKQDSKKLRRKLQKIGIHHSSGQHGQGNNLKPSEPRAFRRSFLGFKKTDMNKRHSEEALPQPLPLDLSDPIWSEYLQTSTRPNEVAYPSPPQSPEESLPATPDLIPEFAHLGMRSAKPKTSSDTISSDGPSTPSTMSSETGIRRRQAKTPVTSIGQLERRLIREVSSVERMAESYRALLDSRCSHFEERFSTPFETLPEASPGFDSTRFNLPGAYPIETILETPEPAAVNPDSPVSSNGTLVGFEEDAIYFKPIQASSQQPDRFSLLQSPELGRLGEQRPQRAYENPSMQIMFDLLTRELSSAAMGSAIRPTAETSALQVWFMIEAYEKLREQMDDMCLPPGQAACVRIMFSTWLRALYAVHSRMTGDDGQSSESDYGDFLGEDLD